MARTKHSTARRRLAREGIFRRAFLRIVVLCAWGSLGVGPAMAIHLQDAKVAIVGAGLAGVADSPQSPLQFAIVAAVSEARANNAGGVVLVGSKVKDVVKEVRTELQGGTLIRNGEGEVEAAVLQGESVFIEQGRITDRRVPTSVTVSATDIELTFEGDAAAVRGMVRFGHIGFDEGRIPMALLAAVVPGAIASGEVAVQTAVAQYDDGSATGWLAALMPEGADEGILVDGAVDEADVWLAANDRVDQVTLEGLATVATNEERCIGAMEFVWNVARDGTTGYTLEVPVCGVEAASQANRRYLYFAKTAD